MRRTSFAGALVVIAVGAVLAFAIRSTPKDLDLQTAGVILVIAGAADLLIRSLLADSPLLAQSSADVAAVVEPLGTPVLDAAGNPIAVPNPAAAPARPPLVAPLPGTMPEGSVAETIVVGDWPYETRRIPPRPPVGQVPVPEPGSVDAAYPESAHPTVYSEPAYPEYPDYRAAVRAEAGDLPDTPESPRAVTTLTGRPVRPRGLGFGRRRRRR